jgi:CRP/FNR family transcriptional regulator
MRRKRYGLGAPAALIDGPGALDKCQAAMNNGEMPRKLRVLTSPSCFGCQSRHRTEWSTLQGDDLELLERAKTCNVYEPGQVVFYEGNACLGIHCVESGSIKLRRSSPKGDDIVVGLAGPGATLGYLAYFGDRGYTTTAEALTPCRVCFIDRAAVKTLIHKSPSVGLAFLRRLSDDVDRSEQERVKALALPLRARVAHLLLVLKDRSASADDEGRLTIELPLSRKDLAAMLGTRPESLSRLIRDFATDGVAHFGPREVVVPDLDTLLDELERAAEA